MNGPPPDAGTNAPSATLVSRLLNGEPLALSRAITAVENAMAGAPAILAAIQPHLGKATVIGITGPPGAGKSTLIDALIKELRARKKTVGVLAVDPSSPLTGGAILGDRVRMAGHTEDAGVFVRSLASRGHLGGLFQAAWGVVQVMDASGPDFILVETVGAGQSEVEITSFVHATIVVCAPGLGDDIQAIKAGILEIANILVVNKSDHPLADHAVQQLHGMLALRDPAMRSARIISTTATTGQGIALLMDALDEIALGRSHNNENKNLGLRVRNTLADTVAQIVRKHIQTTSNPMVESLCNKVRIGEISLDTAVSNLLEIVPVQTLSDNSIWTGELGM